MNPHKLENKAKAQVTGDIGENLDKALEQARDDVQKNLGAQGAFKMGAEKILTLHAHIDQDVGREGMEFLSPELVSYAKQMVTHAHEMMMNLAGQAKAQEVACHGKVKAFEESISVVQRYHNGAQARVDQIVAAEKEPAPEEDDDDQGPRGDGEHPGPSKLDERRAEA